MTMEHLRPLLESPRDTNFLYGACQLLAVANIPQEVKNGLKLGRMTALAKPDGGVRGIVAGDVIRRLTARTMAQRLRPFLPIRLCPSFFDHFWPFHFCQSIFGHRVLGPANFGQSIFGPYVFVVSRSVRPRRRVVAPKGGAEHFALFFPLPLPISFFFSLPGSRGILVVFDKFCLMQVRAHSNSRAPVSLCAFVETARIPRVHPPKKVSVEAGWRTPPPSPPLNELQRNIRTQCTEDPSGNKRSGNDKFNPALTRRGWGVIE